MIGRHVGYARGSSPGMTNRVWDEPLFSRTYEGPGRTLSQSEVRDTVTEAVRRETGTGSGSAA
ncbi:hypothetical protein ACFCXS_23885 [Streptomyces sp. NPDC056373]|uniref:hypothetical protein n=1 Tax=Streptomyces sp. NPDC056373 TaxID=3345798 RepID=UPI0035DF6187